MEGKPEEIGEELRGSIGPARVAVVASSWYAQAMEGLIAGAKRGLADSDVHVKVWRVPGSFEVPLGVSWALDAGYDAAVGLGVVVRGGTPHFDYVCQAATEGIGKVALRTGKPIGFGILTCDNISQALDRCGLEGSREDKGFEAAQAVLQMLHLRQELEQESHPDAV